MLLELRRRIASIARYLDRRLIYHTFDRDILERGKYGFAIRDCWDLDIYLNTVISNAIKRLRYNHMGVPARLCDDGGVDEGEKRWCAILDEIASGLEAGNAAMDEHADAGDPRWEQHKRALEMLVEYWYNLGD